MTNKIKQIDPFTNIGYKPLGSESEDNRDFAFLSNVRELNVGQGGKNVFRADKSGIWLGASKYGDAPSRVDMNGKITVQSIYGKANNDFLILADETLALKSGMGGGGAGASKMTWDFDNIQTLSKDYPDMGSSTYRFGYFHNIGIYCYGSILPNPDPSYSSLGESSRYWQYLWANYVRYKDLASFQHHNDIDLIKNIQEKRIIKNKVIGYDKTKRIAKPIKKKEIENVWDETTMPKEVYQDGFYDAGAVQGLTIGTLKQLIERVENLEEKIEKKSKV